MTRCLKITWNVTFEFFQFWHFPPIFVLWKLPCLVTLFDRKLQVLKNSPKWTIFGILNSLLSTQNVARNVEWDFFCDFQTPWSCMIRVLHFSKKKNISLKAFWQHFQSEKYEAIFCSKIKVEQRDRNRQALKNLVLAKNTFLFTF